MKRPALARLDADERESREASVSSGRVCRFKGCQRREYTEGGWHSTVMRLGRLHIGVVRRNMTVSQHSQDLTDDWSSAAVMETDRGLQGRVATAGHLTRNSRFGSWRETRPGRGGRVGDGSRPSPHLQYLHLLLPVPTARPAEC